MLPTRPTRHGGTSLNATLTFVGVGVPVTLPVACLLDPTARAQEAKRSARLMVPVPPSIPTELVNSLCKSPIPLGLPASMSREEVLAHFQALARERLTATAQLQNPQPVVGGAGGDAEATTVVVAGVTRCLSVTRRTERRRAGKRARCEEDEEGEEEEGEEDDQGEV